jgi:hypothetical protein
VDIQKMTAPEFHSGQGASSATAAPLIAPNFSNTAYKGVTVRAMADNSESIYVGPSGVTPGTGYVLKAGESIDILVDDPAKVYVVSSTAQDYSWIAS